MKMSHNIELLGPTKLYTATWATFKYITSWKVVKFEKIFKEKGCAKKKEIAIVWLLRD